MTGPLQESESHSVNQADAEIASGLVLTHTHGCHCIEGINSLVLNVIQMMSEDEVERMVFATAKLFVETADGITQIAIERDASNNAAPKLPPFLTK